MNLRIAAKIIEQAEIVEGQLDFIVQEKPDLCSEKENKFNFNTVRLLFKTVLERDITATEVNEISRLLTKYKEEVQSIMRGL